MKSMARERKMPMRILEAVDYVNEEQKRVAFNKLNSAFNGHLSGSRIAVWGLAFKPQTDDIREAPALYIIEELLAAGAKIKAFDPEAMDNVKQLMGDRIQLVNDQYEALIDADALIIATEWSVFRTPSFRVVKQLLKNPIIFDGRNLYDLDFMKDQGFYYESIGRQKVC